MMSIKNLLFYVESTFEGVYVLSDRHLENFDTYWNKKKHNFSLLEEYFLKKINKL